MDLKEEHSRIAVIPLDEPENVVISRGRDDVDDVEMMEDRKYQVAFPCALSTGCNSSKSKEDGEPDHMLQCLLVKICTEFKSPTIKIGQLCTILSNRFKYFDKIPFYELVRKIKDMIAAEPCFKKYKMVLKGRRLRCSDVEQDIKPHIKSEYKFKIKREVPMKTYEVIILEDDDLTDPLNSTELQDQKDFKHKIKLENISVLKREDGDLTEEQPTKSSALVSEEIQTETNENDHKKHIKIRIKSENGDSRNSYTISNFLVQPKTQLKYEKSAEKMHEEDTEALEVGIKKNIKLKLDAKVKGEYRTSHGSMYTEVNNEMDQIINSGSLVSAEKRTTSVSIAIQTDNENICTSVDTRTEDELVEEDNRYMDHSETHSTGELDLLDNYRKNITARSHPLQFDQVCWKANNSHPSITFKLVTLLNPNLVL